MCIWGEIIHRIKNVSILKFYIMMQTIIISNLSMDTFFIQHFILKVWYDWELLDFHQPDIIIISARMTPTDQQLSDFRGATGIVRIPFVSF